MSTNRRSTGPRSAEGKAVSRLNALKTGIFAKAEVILPAENPEDLVALAAEYHERFSPATPEQRCLVDSLVSDEWLLRRFRAIEGQLLSRSIRHAFNLDEESPVADAYLSCYDKLDRLQRRINSVRRTYAKTLELLNKLRPAAAPAPSERKPVQSVTASSQFVPSTGPTAPEAARETQPESHSESQFPPDPASSPDFLGVSSPRR